MPIDISGPVTEIPMTEEEWKRLHPGEPYPGIPGTSLNGTTVPFTSGLGGIPTARGPSTELPGDGIDFSGLSKFWDKLWEGPTNNPTAPTTAPTTADYPGSPRGPISSGPGSAAPSGARPVPSGVQKPPPAVTTSTTAPVPGQPITPTADPFNLRPAQQATPQAAATPQGTLALQEYLKMAKGMYPNQEQLQNPYFAKTAQLAEKTMPTQRDMLAAFGFGMAAAPTSDPWRAAGIGGMAALTMKQDGMNRYMQALNNLSTQYEANSRADSSNAQNDRVNQMNLALKMQEADLRSKGIWGSQNGSDRETPQESGLKDLYKKRADVIAAEGDYQYMSPEDRKTILESIDAEIAYLTTGSRTRQGPSVSDQQ